MQTSEVETRPAPRAITKLALDVRPLEYAELVAGKETLVSDEVLRQLSDGRAFVRANAALALAALRHSGPDLAPFLRDGDLYVGLAAAEALVQLGMVQRSNLTAIAAALDGARPEVVAKVQRFFAELIGKADAELIAVLDTGKEVVADAIVAACRHLGLFGLQLLQRATADERVRVRINVVRGIALLGEIDPERSFGVLQDVDRDDGASDVRAAARTAIATLGVRCRAVVAARHKTAPPAPPTVPELERRALTSAELRAAADVAPLEELVRALNAPRAHARINAARALALRGPAEATTARAVAVLLRDEEETVRVEAAQALGVLGPNAIIAAPALACALGDVDPAVRAAAEATLVGFGEAAATALVDGLDAPSEPHGARVAALIGGLAAGPRLLGEALASSSIDAQVHAALGLAALGKARAGGELRALTLAMASPNARVRSAVARAVAVLEPRPERAAPRLAIEGFEDRVLVEPELTKARAALAAAGAAGLARYLSDGRAPVRANAALALGTLGADAMPELDALVVCLRDDADVVRRAAARAIEQLGDAAIGARAHDLVAALRTPDQALAQLLATLLRARPLPAIDQALSAGLDTKDAQHAQRICELVCARPAGPQILYDAFTRVAAQANAAVGLAMLGKDRIGKARALLETARGHSSLHVRELARTALRALEDPPVAPELPAVAGFETTLLEPAAFTGATVPGVAALANLLQDGRAIVRANAATALGALGPAAAPVAPTIAVQLRDDDPRARIAAARALDKLGDEAVVAAAGFLIGALGGEPSVAEACRGVLAARTAKLEDALLAGLETPDELHGMRIAQLICELPNARELLFIAFDSPAQNVQINAALGIGLLGAHRAGPAGRRRLVHGLAGPFTRRRAAMEKALAMLGDAPS